MKRKKAAALRPILNDVEHRLSRSLADVAIAGSSAESTGEVQRLGDTLSEAAQAAKTVVALRRRMHELVILENLERRELAAES